MLDKIASLTFMIVFVSQSLPQTVEQDTAELEKKKSKTTFSQMVVLCNGSTNLIWP